MLRRDAAVARALAAQYVARFARKHVPAPPPGRATVDTGSARYVNCPVNDAGGELFRDLSP